MKNIFKYPLTLGIVGAICAFALATVHGIAQPLIDTQTELAAKQAILDLYPSAEKITDVSSNYQKLADYDIDIIYELTSDGAKSAYAYQVTGMGYSGDMVMLLVLDYDSETILGYTTISHTETKGGHYGDSLLSSELFDAQFNGLSFNDVEDGVDYVAGSTAKITLAGVKKAVNLTIDYHMQFVMGREG